VFLQNQGSFDPGKGPLLDKAAFESTSDFNYYQGSGTRITSMRVFPDRNEDLSLQRQIQLTEKLTFQLRAEAFNVWNWHQFAPPASNGSGAMPLVNDVASPSFGTWVGAVTPPRVFQFGLKLMF
jgi:hypothetical protein